MQVSVCFSYPHSAKALTGFGEAVFKYEKPKNKNASNLWSSSPELSTW